MLDEKKVLILVERDFQDLELFYPKYRFIEEGATVKVAGAGEQSYKGKYGITVNVDGNIEDFAPEDFDAVIIPGGWAPDFMRRSKAMVDFVRKMAQQGKVVAAICHAGWMLASANIIKGKTVTCFEAIKDDVVNAGAKFVDKPVVVDGDIITSRKPDDLPDFCKEIIRKLKE